MPVIRITDIHDERVRAYSCLTDTQLRSRVAPDQGIIIVESPKVIRVAINAGLRPLSLLCELKHISGDAKDIIDALPSDVPIFTGSREVLASLTGYKLTRGVLCAMRRPLTPRAEDVVRSAHRVAVIDNVVDTTNIGAIFRSAAALGLDAVLLTKNSCDPLNRRAIRVSMGTVFLVPWAWIENPNTVLHPLGFQTVAMALSPDCLSIADPILKHIPKLAIIMGTEGEGLPKNVISESDYIARIPMFHNVDSLNVAAAAALAFWELGSRERLRESSPHA